ncbi:MAG TPA: lysylphosphatidylglycerol synthase transmembrane domain-containing protein [Solirubrobacteraceae bacterium]|nr:lysylphosphatidylglycerol synthase transmembrane domain-containing protein [Solirubrobacteraceae bacterium]
MPALLASIGDTFRAFTQAAGEFFDSLANLDWGSLGIALACFGVYLLFRSRASFNALRSAYPDERFTWRRIWGAYVAAYGLNGVVPAGSGSVVQLVLTRASIPNSTYPTVTAALFVGGIFDGVMCLLIMGYAFAQGVFPKPQDFGGLSSFDLAFFGNHPAFTLFAITTLVEISLITVAIMSRRIAEFWSNTRQGFAILSEPRRYIIGMCVPQFAGWLFRAASYMFLLQAFGIGATVTNAILVLAAQVLAAVVPFTPGGVGVQQALLVVIFSTSAPTDTVAAFSVGQQIAITVFTLALGFAALVVIFRYRSFRQVIREARRKRAAEAAA